jgi:hypothetical protein
VPSVFIWIDLIDFGISTGLILYKCKHLQTEVGYFAGLSSVNSLMIDQEVLSVIENRVNQDLEDRRNAFAQEVSQVWGNMSARGMLHSSMTVAQTLDAIGNECRVRVSLIWHAFPRAFDAKKIMISKALASAVKERLAGLLDQGSADLLAQYEKAKQLINAMDALIQIPGGT